MCCSFQLHAEYETLTVSDSQRSIQPVCELCGKGLYDMIFVDGVEGTSWLYSAKESMRTRFCSTTCSTAYSEILQGREGEGVIRNTSNNFVCAVDGLSDVDTMQSEADHFAVSSSSDLKVIAEPAAPHKYRVVSNAHINAGQVLFNVHGEIVDAPDEDAMHDVDERGALLLSRLGMQKMLLLNPGSLALHTPRVSKVGDTPNARIVAHYTLLQKVTSPLLKDNVLVPGAFVVVALCDINRGEDIVVQWPEKEPNREIPLAPEPVDKAAFAAEPLVSSGARVFLDEPFSVQGILRLPGDDDGEGFLAEDVHDENRRFNAVECAARALQEGLPDQLGSAFAADVKNAASEEEKLALVDGTMIWRGAVVCKAGTKLAAAAAKPGSAKPDRPRRSARDRPSAREKYVADEVDEDKLDDAGVYDPLFDPLAAGFDSSKFASIEKLKEIKDSKPFVVNRAYCQDFHAVLSFEGSRALMSPAEGAIALGTCSQLFKMAGMTEGPLMASENCLGAWIGALLKIVSDEELPAKLKKMLDRRAEELAKNAKDAKHVPKNDFRPWVIFESHVGLIFELCKELRGTFDSNRTQRSLVKLLISFSFCLACFSEPQCRNRRRRRRRSAASLSRTIRRPRVSSRCLLPCFLREE